MKVDVLLGLQWGDEGKGKVVDVLTPEYDVIARFQGGPNAGHTLEFDGIKHVLHTIPSGIFHNNKENVVGNGVVIDPIIFIKEIDALKKMGNFQKSAFNSSYSPTFRCCFRASKRKAKNRFYFKGNRSNIYGQNRSQWFKSWRC